MNFDTLPDACAVTCAHIFLLTDCLVRILLRALHSHFRHAPEAQLVALVYNILSIGVYPQNLVADDIATGKYIVFSAILDITITAKVQAAITHDKIHGYYACGITSIQHGDTTIFMPNRLLLLKVRLGGRSMYPDCGYASCCCWVNNYTSGDNVVRAALRQLLTYEQASFKEYDGRLAVFIRYNLKMLTADLATPRQYVDSFNSIGHASICGEEEATPHTLPQPLDILPEAPCAFPFSHMSCKCDAPENGTAIIIDENLINAIEELEHEIHLEAENAGQEDEQAMGAFLT